ncbi:MAG: hypothetical protein QOJ54_7 [Aliidongia sp.]|nr:hypothetical protein [Aliidongia sp.]
MTTTTVIRRPAGPIWALAALACFAPVAASADFHIRSPNEIDQGELELEHNGAWSLDRAPVKAEAQSYTAEFGYGVNSWWHPELELGFERPAGPGQPTDLTGLVWENTFRLTEPGENWADLGFYVEYGFATLAHTTDGAMFGPLVQKDIGRTTQTLNLFLSKDIGPNQDNHGYDFSYAWQSRWNVWRQASPALEIYGDAGQIDRIGKFQDQQLLAGPVVLGTFLLGPLGKLKYEAGYLFGTTKATADGTVRWKLELEIPL